MHGVSCRVPCHVKYVLNPILNFYCYLLKFNAKLLLTQDLASSVLMGFLSLIFFRRKTEHLATFCPKYRTLIVCENANTKKQQQRCFTLFGTEMQQINNVTLGSLCGGMLG